MPPKNSGKKSDNKAKKKRKAKSPLLSDIVCKLCIGQTEDTQVRCKHSVLCNKPDPDLTLLCDTAGAGMNQNTNQNRNQSVNMNPNMNSTMNSGNNLNAMTPPNQLCYGYPFTPQAQLQYATPMRAHTQTSEPAWVEKLMCEIQSIKASSNKVEITVNSINQRVTEKESKFKTLQTKMNNLESTCKFLSDEYDRQTQEAKVVKTDISTMQKAFTELECKQKDLEKQKYELNSKLINLETRSMNENLIFYGIPETQQSENCEELIKEFIESNLKMNAAEIKFDRAHRLGSDSAKKPRGIIVKFHEYKVREEVRQKSFDDDIKRTLSAAKLGVGIQRPQPVREARKAFADLTRSLQAQHHRVRQQGLNLFVDNKLFKVYSDGQVKDPPAFLKKKD